MSENKTPIEEITTENASEIPADAHCRYTGGTHAGSRSRRRAVHWRLPLHLGPFHLTYAIGRHKDTGELHLRIVENSGKGMWFDGWASAKDIDAIVKGATELTAKSFHCAASRQVHQHGRLCHGGAEGPGPDPGQ
jgi:hypothetical protein